MTDGASSQTLPLVVPVEIAFWLHGFIAVTALSIVFGLVVLRFLGRRSSVPLIFMLSLFAVQALGNIAYQMANPGWMPHLAWFIAALELRAIVGFVLGPLALFYVREFLDPTMRTSWSDAWHALPTLIMAATLYIWPEWEINIYAYASAAVLMVYAGLAGRELAASGYLRNGDADRQTWLWVSGVLFLLLLGVNAVATNFNCRPISDPMVRLYQAGLLVGILALIYGFLIAGLWRGFVLFPGEDSEAGRSGPNVPRRADPALAERFVGLMHDKALWREPDINLGRIAEALAVSPRRLSLAVRDDLGVSIVDWINARRVEAVKLALEADPETHLSLLDLALDAGFNSKPSFNRAFSKFTGMTPSAYRDKLRNT